MSKDLKWLPDEPGIYSHIEAMKLEDETKRLPTIGELRMAWEQGMKFEEKWYWSSSFSPNFSDLAYGINGPNGGIGSYDHYFDGTVRMVSR